MKLYSLDGASVVSAPNPDNPDESLTFTADEDGAIDGLPEGVYNSLLPLHNNGKKLWENEVERDARLTAEEDARRKDPATLLAAVERLNGQQRELTAAELRAAHEERNRIRDEEEQRERLKVEAAEDAERARARAEAEAAVEAVESVERARTEAEAKAIAKLPVHTGDTVVLTSDTRARFVTDGGDEGYPEWVDEIGTVTDVARENVDDADSRFITLIEFDGGHQAGFGLESLTVVDRDEETRRIAEAQAARDAADLAAQQQQRVAEESAEAIKAGAPASGTTAPASPAKKAAEKPAAKPAQK